MGDIRVRFAKPEDAPQIAKIHVKTWQCAYRGQIPDAYLDSLSIEKRTKSWEENLNNSKSESKTFVAEEDGKILGFANVGSSRDKEVSPETGELWSIYVDPDNMGKGVGTQLLNASLGYLREQGFKKAILWVLTSNHKTRDWYESKGWKVEGKTKTEKRDNFELDEIRYMKNL